MLLHHAYEWMWHLNLILTYIHTSEAEAIRSRVRVYIYLLYRGRYSGKIVSIVAWLVYKSTIGYIKVNFLTMLYLHWSRQRTFLIQRRQNREMIAHHSRGMRGWTLTLVPILQPNVYSVKCIVFASSKLANSYIIIFRSYMGDMLQIHVFSSIHK